MRILPGHPKEFANETPTSLHLMKYAVSEPEILPQVATLFSNEHSAFSSLLAERGLTSGDLYNNANPKAENYTPVGNRKVKWRVEGMENRKGTFTHNAVCDAYATEPGKHQSLIELYVDTNWFSPKDVLELSDNKTLVHVVDDNLPDEVGAGAWRYYVKLVTGVNTDYVDTDILAAGEEIGFAYTMFEELSETAYEKYTFHEEATTYMTIQRMKWSISGTAAAMGSSKIWVEHNGQAMWMEKADYQMLRRWAKAREYQLLFGKGTVTDKDVVLLKDLKGREIMGGDGLMNQGDGAFRLQYNHLTEKTIQNVMKNMQLFTSNSSNITEVAVIAGQDALWNFHHLMADVLKANPVTIVEGSGSSKGVNMDVAYYQMAGIRFTPVWYKWFDSPERPQATSGDGQRYESQRMIFVSLGDVDVGKPNVELLSLGQRSFLRGSVYGINRGGEGMSNSVDGEHHHVLAETGIALINVNGVAELYRPR